MSPVVRGVPKLPATSHRGHFWHVSLHHRLHPPQSAALFLNLFTLYSSCLPRFSKQPFHPSLLLSLLLLLLIMRASNAPYGRSPTPAKAHGETWVDDVSGAVFANDKGVCIPAPLLLRRFETRTQIDTQLGPTITIPASPPSPILSIHASLLLPPTSAFISQLQSVSLSSSQVSSPPLTPVLFPQLP